MTVAKAKIDGSITQLLQSNFDQDSKIVIITILKILDNILQQPYNDKVRKIRLQNKAFHKKVVSKKGGINVLVACGFQLQKAPPKLLESSTSLSLSSSSPSPDEFLILTEAFEDTDTIVLARQMLHQVAIHQLRCPPDEVPPMKPPVRKQPLSTSSTSSTTTTTTHPSTGFNVYQGHRYDGQSAAVGTNLGPPQNWKSATDAKLERLQKQQQQLERKLQNPKQLSHDRQWKASLTPLTNASLLASLTSSSTNDNTASSFSSSSDNDDKALLAQHLQKQHQQRLKEENRGFTTKAMRDLEKIKHQKVYSHVVLAIQFQDGCTIRGHFLPKDTLQTVKDELASSVFVDSSSSGASVPNDYELYVTPPRTILDPNSTLQALGLVPASKIYVSWKTPLSPPPPLGAGSGGGSLPSGWYVRQSLFATNTVTTTSLPASEVVGESATTTTTNATSSTKPAVAKKKKKTKAEKEAAMLQRMMGK